MLATRLSAMLPASPKFPRKGVVALGLAVWLEAVGYLVDVTNMLFSRGPNPLGEAALRVPL